MELLFPISFSLLPTVLVEEGGLMELKSRPVLSVVTLVVVIYGMQGGGAVRPRPTGLGGGGTSEHDKDPLLLSRLPHALREHRGGWYCTTLIGAPTL